jgi:signal transduction histidine kinase
MSRELHDVVAHGLSVIAVQADAAEAALAHDPVLAAEPVRAIKAGARQSLQELRQMLQVLRDDEDASPGWPAQPPRPAPGIGALAELIQGVRAAGLPIEWVLSRPGADAAAKPADDLAGGVELAVYRIVQEALTNVLKHAGGVPTRVRVRIDESAVDVEVCNAAGAAPSSACVDGGRTADGGRGLIGVRERVAALHGSVEAGPIHAGELAGGYRLHARLPRADVNEPSR